MTATRTVCAAGKDVRGTFTSWLSVTEECT